MATAQQLATAWSGLTPGLNKLVGHYNTLLPANFTQGSFNKLMLEGIADAESAVSDAFNQQWGALFNPTRGQAEVEITQESKQRIRDSNTKALAKLDEARTQLLGSFATAQTANPLLNWNQISVVNGAVQVNNQALIDAAA